MTDTLTMADTITHWAICEGGLIQHASPEVTCIDLDWQDHDGPEGLDIDDLETQWRVVHLAIAAGGDWRQYVDPIREALVVLYDEVDVPETERIWSR